MIWGRYIFPSDYVAPTPFTVGQPKPDQLPSDLKEAVNRIVQAARSEGFAMASGNSDRLELAQDYTDSSRAHLYAVTLKHLRGEA